MLCEEQFFTFVLLMGTAADSACELKATAGGHGPNGQSSSAKERIPAVHRFCMRQVSLNCNRFELCKAVAAVVSHSMENDSHDIANSVTRLCKQVTWQAAAEKSSEHAACSELLRLGHC